MYEKSKDGYNNKIRPNKLVNITMKLSIKQIVSIDQAKELLLDPEKQTRLRYPDKPAKPRPVETPLDVVRPPGKSPWRPTTGRIRFGAPWARSLVDRPNAVAKSGDDDP